jgi:hypothetical protein
MVTLVCNARHADTNTARTIATETGSGSGVGISPGVFAAGPSLLDADQMDSLCQVSRSLMARSDWTYALSIAITLALAVGAVCILLFAAQTLGSE